jgi:hypothetical protein
MAAHPVPCGGVGPHHSINSPRRPATACQSRVRHDRLPNHEGTMHAWPSYQSSARQRSHVPASGTVVTLTLSRKLLSRRAATSNVLVCRGHEQSWQGVGIVDYISIACERLVCFPRVGDTRDSTRLLLSANHRTYSAPCLAIRSHACAGEATLRPVRRLHPGVCTCSFSI